MSSQPASEPTPVVFVLNEHDDLALQRLRVRDAMRTIWKQTIVASRKTNVDFLLGGEFPVPVMTHDAAQRTRAAAAATIQFKEYGVSVRLRINDIDDTQRLAVGKLTPQIATVVDLTRKVRFEDYIIPALASRRTTKRLIISPGETIALVDLLTQEELSSLSRIGFGSIDKSAFSELRKFARATGQQLDLMLLVTPNLYSESLTRAPNDSISLLSTKRKCSYPALLAKAVSPHR
ncbi:MAG: hypothetical protein WKF84_23700 [Pyrinomonadaceae bacterium]